jgi:hypothetical protein
MSSSNIPQDDNLGDAELDAIAGGCHREWSGGFPTPVAPYEPVFRLQPIVPDHVSESF